MTDMTNELADRIRSRCYWETTIRPERFTQRHIQDYGRLVPIVRESAVSLRGWDFPHVDDRREAKRRGQDWAGEELVWREHLELWRLYQSGLFVSLSGMWYDWEGRTDEKPEGNGAVGGFPLWDTIYRFTEIYEFAARLALTEAGDDAMRVQVKIGNLGGRTLFQDNRQKTGLRHYEYLADSFTHPSSDASAIPREVLIAQPREFAANALLDLLRRFEFAVSVESIRAWQAELGRR